MHWTKQDRDAFAERQLTFPFRRGYDWASLEDVETWHDELAGNARFLLKYGWLLQLIGGCWLYRIVSDAIAARQIKRDEARMDAMQKARRRQKR